jgi:hypothetical protein
MLSYPRVVLDALSIALAPCLLPPFKPLTWSAEGGPRGIGCLVESELPLVYIRLLSTQIEGMLLSRMAQDRGLDLLMANAVAVQSGASTTHVDASSRMHFVGKVGTSPHSGDMPLRRR